MKVFRISNKLMETCEFFDEKHKYIQDVPMIRRERANKNAFDENEPMGTSE